jgi:hypothetical protein
MAKFMEGHRCGALIHFSIQYMKRLFLSGGFSILVFVAGAQKAPDTLSNATL